MWKIDPKDKHILKNKHDHTHIHMYNTLVAVELLHGTQGKRGRN
jgi:hypothetical protein